MPVNLFVAILLLLFDYEYKVLRNEGMDHFDDLCFLDVLNDSSPSLLVFASIGRHELSSTTGNAGGRLACGMYEEFFLFFLKCSCCIYLVARWS